MFSRIGTWAVDQGAAFTTAKNEVEEFVRTATYSIPPAVTDFASDLYDPVSETVYTTVPEWYSALPTAVRQFKDEEARAIVSAFDAVNGGVTAGFDMGTTIAFVVVMTFSLVVSLL